MGERNFVEPFNSVISFLLLYVLVCRLLDLKETLGNWSP